MSSTPASLPARLPLLDGLRAVAAGFVLLFHYDAVFGGLSWARHGELAVDFFFLLSGVVLSAGVDRQCGTWRGGVDFLIARVGRLWPIMALGTLAGLMVALLDGQSFGQLAGALALALLFIPHLENRAPIFPLDGPQWSLMLELIANIAHVLILRRLSTRGLLTLAGASWLGLAALAQSKGEITFGAMNPGWQLGVLRIGYAYTLGCVIARQQGRLAAAMRLPWWVPALLLSLLLLAPGRGPEPDGWLDALTLLAFAAVLISSLSARPPAAWEKPLRLAGAASWPLYAFHIPAFNAAKWIASRGFAPLELAAPAMVAIVIGLSVVVATSPLAKGIRFGSIAGLRLPKRLYVGARVS